MSTNASTVSVIVPFYNEEKYLQECLESLTKQTYTPLEVIAIDDGSTDRSQTIVETFPTVKLLNQNHAGPGMARNLGAAKARGNILVFADADMVYDPEYVSRLVKPIARGTAFGTSHIDERVANRKNIWSKCWSINAGHEKGKRTPPHLSGKLNIFRALKLKDFLRVGGFDPYKGYFDDISLSEKLGKKSDVVHGAIAYHYNPSTLLEVFFSARWIGKSPDSICSLQNVLRYSFLNSLRNGIRKVIDGAPSAYILFKLVYDTGMLFGIFAQKNTAK